MSVALVEIINVIYTTGSVRTVQAHLVADTVADLPQPSGLPGYLLTIGSDCDVIQDSARYVMQSSGVWVQQLHDVSADTYTRAQIDTLIAQQAAQQAAALAAAQTALQADIDTRLKFTLGTPIVDPDPAQGVYADLFELPPGKYYRQTNIAYVLNRPTGFSSAFYCVVENTISTTRQRITLYSAGATTAGSFYTSIQTGTPPTYGPWYRYDATQL